MKTLTITFALDDDQLKFISECGFVKWSATDDKPQTDKQHAAYFKKDLKLTRESFPSIPEKSLMHIICSQGADTVYAYTGNTPTAPLRTSILAGLWNGLIQSVRESNVPPSPGGEAAPVHGLVGRIP